MNRTFEDKPATRTAVPLLMGITGFTGSGKTVSALRLASGMQKIIGGDIFFIDTEHRRALEHAEKFKFRHLDLKAPFASLDYLAAMKHCLDRGGKIIICDTMTLEHSGEGGYLAQSEKFLQEKCGDDYGKRQRFSRMSWIKPSRERKQLTDWIIQQGINGIFCYRAKEKSDEQFKPTGWQPETTSDLIWEMQARFLLMPACEGRPTFTPDMQSEKMLTKNPWYFESWFKNGMQLNEDIGQKLSLWAKGESNATPAKDQTGEMAHSIPVERPAVDRETSLDEWGVIEFKSKASRKVEGKEAGWSFFTEDGQKGRRFWTADPELKDKIVAFLPTLQIVYSGDEILDAKSL